MKIIRNISYGIIFSIAVILCFGPNLFSNSLISINNIEFVENSKTDTQSSPADSETVNDDEQIMQSYLFCFEEESVCNMPVTGTMRIIPDIPNTSWQPPKIS
jgi:hypothetical protein